MTPTARRSGFAASFVLVQLACMGLPGAGVPGTTADGAPVGPMDGHVAGAPAGSDWLVRYELASGGVQRSAFLHVPKGYDPNGKDAWPLLVLSHGGPGQLEDRGLNMAARWDHMANRDFLMVFPNGIGDEERAWVLPGSGYEGDGNRDLNFILDLMAELEKDYRIDAAKVYAAGFSNGSGFTWGLQCYHADKFAGFGNVEQTMAKMLFATCQPPKQVPGIYIHGDADARKAAWEGTAATTSVEETKGFMLAFHGCDPNVHTDTESDRPSDATRVVGSLYAGCKNVPAWSFYRVYGGMHQWPTQHRSKLPDGCSSDIDASEEIVNFWRTYAGL